MVVPNITESPLVWSVGVELGGMPKLSAMEHLGLPFIRTVVGGSTIPVYLGALNRLTGPWENSGALPAIGRLKVKRHSCST